MFIGLSVIAGAIFTSGNFIVDALIVLFISIRIFKDAETQRSNFSSREKKIILSTNFPWRNVGRK
ncbi:MAG: hypothetical protein Q4P17_02795 [Methanobacterium sp.]|nr:hypothetical protein [Methanobacterium sp.]